MAFDSNVRREILLQIAAQGGDVPSALAQEIARLVAEVAKTTESFAAGETTAKEFQSTISSLNSDIRKMTDLYEEATGAVRGHFVALEDLESKAIEVSAKAMEAAERNAIREAEEFARKIAEYEAWVTKKEAADERAELKEADALVRRIEAYERWEQRQNEATERAELKEAEALARRVEAYERWERRQEETQERLARRQQESTIKEAIREATRELDNYDKAMERLFESEGKEIAAKRAEEKAVLDSRMAWRQYIFEYVKMLQLKKEGVVAAGEAARAMLEEELATVAATKAANSATEGVQKTAGAKNAATAATRNWNQIIIQTSYGLGDLMQTSGGLGQKLMSVTNNVQMAASGFGLWGAAVGVVTTVVASAIMNWESLAKLFGTAGDQAEISKGKIGALKDRINELESKKIRISVEDEELDKAREKLKQLQQDQQDYEAFGKLRSAAERESGQAVEKALAERPGDEKELADKLAEQRVERVIENSPVLKKMIDQEEDLKAKLEKARTMYNAALKDPTADSDLVAGFKGDVDRAEAAYDKVLKAKMEARKQAEREVGHMFGQAKLGYQKEQNELADELEAAGEKELAKEIREADPRTIITKKQRKEEAERVRKNTALWKKRQDEEQRQIYREDAAAETEAKQIAKNEEQQRAFEVNRHATDLSHAMAQDKGSSSLRAQIAQAAASGASDAQIMNQLAPMVSGRADVAGVPAHMISTVVNNVLAEAIRKLRAEAAAHGNSLQEGAAGIMAEIRAKEDQKATAADNRAQAQARKPLLDERRERNDARSEQENQLAQGFQEDYGATEQQSHVMARDMMNRMAHGVDQWTALNQTLMHMMHQFQALQERQQREFYHLQGQVNQMSHKQNRMRNHRPSLLPTF